MESKCPNCQSTNIRNDSVRNNNGIIGPGCKSWVVEEKYLCNDCGVYFKPLTKKDLNLAVMGHGESERAQGPVWVKASEFKHEIGMPYHAKDNRFKGAGLFDKDGHFRWGDGTITFQRDQGDLLILDESTPAGREEMVDLIEYIRENFEPSKEVWTDKFGIALLSDDGVFNKYKQQKNKP